MSTNSVRNNDEKRFSVGCRWYGHFIEIVVKDGIILSVEEDYQSPNCGESGGGYTLYNPESDMGKEAYDSVRNKRLYNENIESFIYQILDSDITVFKEFFMSIKDKDKSSLNYAKEAIKVAIRENEGTRTLHELTDLFHEICTCIGEDEDEKSFLSRFN